MTTLTVVRAGLLALAIVALGFVPGVSVADPPSATDHASATGHGDFMASNNGTLQLRFFSFSAVKQPNGNVAGQAEIRREVAGAVIQVIHMDIDCLHFVSTNTVRVSGTIKKSNQAFLEGQIGVFLARDNGEGTKSLPDVLSLLRIFFPWQNVDCNTPLTFSSHDVQHGNIQVRP